MSLDMTASDEDVVARYRARYSKQDLIFRLFDHVLAIILWPWRKKTISSSRPIRRILIINAGHIGDVIMSTAVLPVLHHAFPGVEIGFMTGPYSRSLVEGHPLIARTHILDHWYLSRQAAPLARRVIRYVQAVPGMIRELRSTDYDMAIDLRTWFPNFVPLAWLARIPVRAAYDRLGFGPVLTHRLRYGYERRHEVDYYLELLRAVGVPAASLALASPNLKPHADKAQNEASALLGEVTRFRVIHPCGSTPVKNWVLESWCALGNELTAAGITPVITGSGPKEQAVADAIAADVPGSINAVDKVSWAGLLALLGRAEAVYAVDTSVGHAASALGRPVISITGGTADPVHWAPFGAAVATHLLPCHPCIDKNGCAARSCLTELSVDAVRSAALTVAVPVS